VIYYNHKGENKMAKTIELKFDGYINDDCLDPDKHNKKGVYAVYAGRHLIGENCHIGKLLYIGVSGNDKDVPGVYNRKHGKWDSYLDGNYDETLYYSFAETDNEDEIRTALVNEFHPVCNDISNNSPVLEDGTVIKTSGSNDFLNKSFIIKKN
jgi:hypothetical protein